MLGDKIKELLQRISLRVSVNVLNEILPLILQSEKELNQLLEYKTKYEEKCQELEADHAASEEVIEELTLEYNGMCEENEQLKEDALLGKATELFFAHHEGYTEMWGVESNKIDSDSVGLMTKKELIIWYKQQLEKEGSND